MTKDAAWPSGKPGQPLNGGEGNAPVEPRDRIVLWDVLRGVAVLGILLANMPFMGSAWALTSFEGGLVSQGVKSTGDLFAFHFVRLVAETKFISIFSILFGAGVALMSEKVLEKGGGFLWFFSRRLAVLLGFGLLHGLFLWFGDILTHYSLVGFVAMCFHRASPIVLVVLALLCLLLSLGLTAGFAIVSPETWHEWGQLDVEEESERRTLEEDQAVQVQEYREVFSSGEFGPMFRTRAELFGLGVLMISFVWGFRTLGFFLLGMYLVKSGILKHPGQHKVALKRFVVWGLAIGLPAHALWFMQMEGDSLWVRELQNLGNYFAAGLSFAYIAWVAAWCGSSRFVGLRRRLQAVGQMALTNYISHSVITALIFNYMGFYDAWGRLTLLALTAAVFSLQLLLSPVWLTMFRYGPLEWVWRSTTYFKLQPFRR